MGIKMPLRKPRARVLYNYLLNLYTKLGTGGSFGGAEQLFKIIKKENKYDIKKRQVTDFLSKLDSYTLHKNARKRFKTQPVIIGTVNELHQADLMDMVSIMAHNNGMRYILVVIDCFSRMAWAEPLKTKSAVDMLGAFEKIYKRTLTPEKLTSDKGIEFLNSTVQHFFISHDITYVPTHGLAKAQFVERLIRSLKSLLWRYFTYNKTYKFYDILPALMNEYNNRYHTSIHMSPRAVNNDNEKEVFNTLYGHMEHGKYIKQTPKYAVGDLVRISKWKHTFKKSYEENYTDEIFRISDVLRGPLVQYRLYDLDYEHIIGKFYQPELVRVDKNEL